MIGIGNWKAELSSKYVNGDVSFTIADKDGKYDLDIKLPDQFKGFKLKILDIKEEGDNVLTGKAQVKILAKTLDIDAKFTFTEDTVEGLLSFGSLGNVKVINGKKIS